MNSPISTIVIAAAGRGTRMRELAADKPKHLVEVAARPFLWYSLEAARQAGFEQLIVVMGHHADVMRTFLASLPFPVIAVEQTEQVGDKYGTAAVVEAVAIAVGNQPFVFQNGDSLYTPKTLQTIRAQDGFHHLFGMQHADPRSFGVLDVDAEGFLQQVIEKPEVPPSNLINAGLYQFQPEIFEQVRNVQPSVRNEYELTDAINALAAHRRVKVDVLTDEWAHLTTPEDIPSVEAFIQQHYSAYLV